MITEQMGFLTDGIHPNNISGCLLKLLAKRYHRFGVFHLNFSVQHPSVSNSWFCGSAGSGHIPKVTALLLLHNHEGHYKFWVQKLAGYVTYGADTSAIVYDFTFLDIQALLIA